MQSYVFPFYRASDIPFFLYEIRNFTLFLLKKGGSVDDLRFHFFLLGVGPGVTGEGEGLHGVSLPCTLAAVCLLYNIYMSVEAGITLYKEECTLHAVLSTEL